MMKKEYTKPAAEVVNLNCSNDMMDDGTFTYSNIGTADGGGRQKRIQLSTKTLGKIIETSHDGITLPSRSNIKPVRTPTHWLYLFLSPPHAKTFGKASSSTLLFGQHIQLGSFALRLCA